MHYHTKGIRDCAPQNITIFTESEVTHVSKRGGQNNFTAEITKKPRYVHVADCTACQLCEKACPVNVTDEYQYGLIGRKAAFIPFSIANPKAAVIDIENCTLCGACERVCPPTHCIDFTMETELYELKMKTVILATGFRLFDPLEIPPRYGYGQYKNVITSMQMEREIAPTRPTTPYCALEMARCPTRLPTCYAQAHATTLWAIPSVHRYAACTPLSRHNCSWGGITNG